MESDVESLTTRQRFLRLAVRWTEEPEATAGLFMRQGAALTMDQKRYILYTMLEFAFDRRKSDANKGKHGIDFVEAQALWQDDRRIEIPARTRDEARFLVVGWIGETHWSAVITYRGETVRIISVRRSRREEVELYESEEF